MNDTQTRILLLAPVYPPYVGGIANHSEEFVAALTKRGVEVTVYTPALPDPARMTECPGARIIRYPALEPIPAMPIPALWDPSFHRTLHRIEDRAYTCVISRTRFFASTLLAWRYAWRNRIPWIHVEHGSAHVRVGNPVISLGARMYDATIGKRVFRSADAVVAVSRAVVEFVERESGRHGQVIYRGLDFDAYNAIVPCNELRVRFEGKLLLFWSGRMCYWKGVQLILDALRLLDPQNLARVHLLLVGDGEERMALERSAHGLPITFFGSQSRSNTLAMLRAVDIYVHASLPGGGLSTSLLEAMCYGKSVVATPHEGADEVIRDGETGILAPNGTPRELARGISTLVQNPQLRNTLGSHASVFIANKFDWDTITDTYLELISQLSETYVRDCR